MKYNTSVIMNHTKCIEYILLKYTINQISNIPTIPNLNKNKQ